MSFVKTDGVEFRRLIKGKNCMTPDIIDYYTNGHYIVELSEGVGGDDEYIYGVTIVDGLTKKGVHNLSTMFYDKDEAIDYIMNLKGEFDGRD